MDEEHTFCPIYNSIDLLQEKWTLHIIRSLLDGPRGFNELSRAIGGCNPATLAQRLDRLEGIGIVKKTVHSVMPPRTSYELTPAGRNLQKVIGSIARWARRHLKVQAGRAREGNPSRTRLTLIRGTR